ncbi:MAG TPA: hypothetical protein GYA08_04895 [Chloroflexi bacterium]|nr:hypothetical protein [Chloroflexota bacterium]
MTRILTTITLLIIVFALTACGGGEDKPTATVTPPPTVAATATNTPQPAPTATATPTPPATTAADAPESPLAAPESPLDAPSSPLAAPESPLPTPLPEAVYPEVTPGAETGVLMGRIVTTYDQQPRIMAGTSVRLGTIFWNTSNTDGASATPTAEADGVFVIEGGSSPGALTDDNGIFVIENLSPGEYVMAVGDLIGMHEFILAENHDDARVFKVEAGAVLNVGTIEVNLP